MRPRWCSSSAVLTDCTCTHSCGSYWWQLHCGTDRRGCLFSLSDVETNRPRSHRDVPERNLLRADVRAHSLIQLSLKGSRARCSHRPLLLRRTNTASTSIWAKGDDRMGRFSSRVARDLICPLATSEAASRLFGHEDYGASTTSGIFITGTLLSLQHHTHVSHGEIKISAIMRGEATVTSTWTSERHRLVRSKCAATSITGSWKWEAEQNEQHTRRAAHLGVWVLEQWWFIDNTCTLFSFRHTIDCIKAYYIKLLEERTHV